MICFFIFLSLIAVGYSIYPEINYEYFTYYQLAFAVTLSFACSLRFAEKEKTGLAWALILNFIFSNFFLWPYMPGPIPALVFDTIFATLLYVAGANVLAILFSLMSLTNAAFFFFPFPSAPESYAFVSVSRPCILALLGHAASVALSSDSGDDWTFKKYGKFFNSDRLRGFGFSDNIFRSEKNN